jgi:hypothetical protein
LAGRLSRQTWLADLTQTFSIFELQSSQCVLALRLLANILAQSDSAAPWTKGRGFIMMFRIWFGGRGGRKKINKKSNKQQQKLFYALASFFL